MEKTMPGKEKNGGYVVESQEQMGKTTEIQKEKFDELMRLLMEGKPIIVTASGQVIVDRAKDGGNAGVDA